MHLYVYSTNNPSGSSSRYNFDDAAYQNLLGIKWFNPYDENYKVELECINLEKAIGKTEVIPPITGIEFTTNNSIYKF